MGERGDKEYILLLHFIGDQYFGDQETIGSKEVNELRSQNKHQFKVWISYLFNLNWLRLFPPHMMFSIMCMIIT